MIQRLFLVCLATLTVALRADPLTRQLEIDSVLKVAIASTLKCEVEH